MWLKVRKWKIGDRVWWCVCLVGCLKNLIFWNRWIMAINWTARITMLIYAVNWVCLAWALCYTTRRISEEPIRWRLGFCSFYAQSPSKIPHTSVFERIVAITHQRRTRQSANRFGPNPVVENLEPKDLHGLDLRFSNSWRHRPDPNRHSHSLRGQPVSYLCKPLFIINQTFYHIFIFSFVEKRAIRRN